MKTENKTLMRGALDTLKGKWGIAVGATFVYMLTSIIVSSLPKIGSLLSFIISGPLLLGFSFFWLSLSRNKEVKIGQIFSGFDEFIKGLVLYFLVVLFTLLWSLLLIIPGIIAAFSYAMAFYILAEDKSIRPMDAIRKSKKMMEGNKWKLFCLNLRFLGWALLAILTLGIGFLWLVPYMQVSIAKFYDDIKEKDIPVPAIG